MNKVVTLLELLESLGGSLNQKVNAYKFENLKGEVSAFPVKQPAVHTCFYRVKASRSLNVFWSRFPK